MGGHRQLQVPQDLPNDTALGDHRDDQQRALLTHGAACISLLSLDTGHAVCQAVFLMSGKLA
jgi:hypothetical protein